METAVLGGGCFWCTEALFKNLKGVKSVLPGYSNHAESIKIEFDPKIISFKDILYIFMKTHDPTSLNRQGADVGTQYRSAIFYTSQDQEKIASDLINELQKEYNSPIVTEITKFSSFHEAEDYHKNYYENHKDALYCKLVIDPKLAKLKRDFIKYTK